MGTVRILVFMQKSAALILRLLSLSVSLVPTPSVAVSAALDHP